MTTNKLLRCFLTVALVIASALHAVAAQECGIASAHELATKAGCEILRSGGNAFDAAVAVAAALAVVEPFASGIGGGGFFLLHRASDNLDIFIDARETAPSRATRDFFVDNNGQAKQKAALQGPTAAGIPGEPAALDWLAGHYGKLPLARTLAPSIRLAEQGFAADARYAAASRMQETVLQSNGAAADAFLDHGKAAAVGFVVIQPKLAKTLHMLGAEGASGFYRGDFARRLVTHVQSAGGLWELSDLENYRVIERPPVKFTYRGARITTSPLPSSGGLVLAQSLFILEPTQIARLSESERAHYIVEAMRRGYQDRARYMGDPDFFRVPVKKLASREYALARGASIDPQRATPSSALAQEERAVEEGADTSHFSIIDAAGNRVAATVSVNGPFGSGFVAGDTGVILNNHMDDFVLVPGVPNLYKLVGSKANAIQPGKRPLSSMSPTFVEDDRGVLVLGTPGGSRIISMVLEGVLAYVDQAEVDLKRLVGSPRFHHQYLPDRIEFEPGGFSDDWIDAMKAKGHVVEPGKRKWGNMQAVFWNRKTGQIETASDPRGQSGVLF